MSTQPPGLNVGAFNLGAGLSFAVIFAVKPRCHPPTAAVRRAATVPLVAGLVILAVAFVTSFLILRPVDAEAGAPSLSPRRPLR